MRWEVAPVDTGPDPQTGQLVYLVSAQSDGFAEWLSLTVMVEDAGGQLENEAAALARAAEFARRFAAEASSSQQARGSASVRGADCAGEAPREAAHATHASKNRSLVSHRAQEAGMTDRVTRAEAAAVLGNVDEQVLVDVIATGATKAEVAEAFAWVENDEAMLNEGRAMPGGRAAQVVVILQAQVESEAIEP
ncbi:hypothetical protein MOX02_47180 [Methylobacterium oxalidis]|uniref:Uncharacterized protein n=2 Tax=Methylobacterium oxalidis TaxID=944322 RepID=A0A512J9P4_9HYPH|nr:hypothetical protein MOX02_47180 [Methylobacterium oxalidis]GLS67310.1 hypothetical protein GCM10007888_56930 [Methylobacterium oxalidis]